MKVALISDTHGSLPSVESFQDADIIIHAGDVGPDRFQGSSSVLPWYSGEFSEWATKLDRPIYLTWGNHDFIGQRLKPNVIKDYVPSNINIYIDEGDRIGGKEFYFSPWSNLFGSWAFMEDERGLNRIYRQIPSDTQILISHGPPKGYGDKIYWDGIDQHVGSIELGKRISELKQLELVVCGHIHSARGKYQFGNTNINIHNVSVVDEAYRLMFDPIFIEL